ncbi:polysaccharide deacetylase family protein [Saxibacter everestensis]|uniref:Polysaccharide deacetylase family protein n=1 Tax=Saxibacter everestensis TaxID=2909229 RepID=A0ABY8QY44_9MICO|nr:polysaccharide deacetylase family protein [Brevibacteriaceae bacterium ZFBP1038]
MRWPEDAACGVVVTIDLDGDLPFLAASPENHLRVKSRSVGHYGIDAGSARLLRVLREASILATWFVPGEIARRHPGLVREIDAQGHLIGVHGDLHLDFDELDLLGQLREMTRGRAALAEVLGEAPLGFRTTAGEWALDFPREAASAGFTWSSSLPSDDVPFRVAPGLMEVPFRYETEDYQYLAYNLDPPFPPGQSRITPIEVVEENWWQEYLGAARWGTLFVLRLNAELMGTPGRARMLRRFLGRIHADGRGIMLTCADAARLAEVEPASRHEHPYQRFERLFVEGDERA